MAAKGMTNIEIADSLNTTRKTVGKWRKRYLGYVEGVTHDYVRHGTTTLFAALDIANGKVLK